MGPKPKPAAAPIPSSEVMGVPGHPFRPNFDRIAKMADQELVATIQSLGKDHGDVEKAAILDPLLREAATRGLDTDTPLAGLTPEAQAGHAGATSVGEVMALARGAAAPEVNWDLINRALREYGHLVKAGPKGFCLGDLAGAILDEVHRNGEASIPTGPYAQGQAFDFFDRQHVVCNGYPGIVVGKLGGMVEVRLNSGEVCVPSSFPDCYPDNRFPMIEALTLAKAQRFVRDDGGGPFRRLLPSNSLAYTVYADPSGILHDRQLPVDQWRPGDGWVQPKEFEASGLEWAPTADVGLLRADWNGHPAGSLVIAGIFRGKDWDGSHEDIEAIAIRPRTKEEDKLEAGAGAKTNSPKKVFKNALREILDGGVAYKYEEKEAFHREAKRVLRALAKEMGLASGAFDLRSNKAGIAVSGEITLHTDRIYVQVSESHGTLGEVLYRTCKGQKDYTGGRNHFAKVEELVQLTDFAIRLKNLKD